MAKKKITKKIVKKVSSKKISKKSNWIVWGGLVLAVVLIGGWMMKGEKVGINEVAEDQSIKSEEIVKWILKDPATFQTNININKRNWQPMFTSKGYAVKHVEGVSLTNLADKRGIRISSLYPMTSLQKYSLELMERKSYYGEKDQLKNLIISVDLMAVPGSSYTREPYYKDGIRYMPSPTPTPANMQIPMTVELYSRVNSKGKRTLLGTTSKNLDVSFARSFNFTFDFVNINPHYARDIDMIRAYVTPGDANAWYKKYGKSTLVIKTISMTTLSRMAMPPQTVTLKGLVGRESLPNIDNKEIARIVYTLTSTDGKVYNLSYKYAKDSQSPLLDISTMVGKNVEVTGYISEASGSGRSLFLAHSIKAIESTTTTPSYTAVPTAIPVASSTTDVVELPISGGIEVEANSLY